MRRLTVILLAILYTVTGIFVAAHQHVDDYIDERDVDLSGVIKLYCVVMWPPFAIVDLVNIAEEWME